MLIFERVLKNLEQSDLEKFILSKHPKNAADVEHIILEFQRNNSIKGSVV